MDHAVDNAARERGSEATLAVEGDRGAEHGGQHLVGNSIPVWSVHASAQHLR